MWHTWRKATVVIAANYDDTLIVDSINVTQYEAGITKFTDFHHK